MTYKYFLNLEDALNAVQREDAKQSANKTFYNITLRKTKNGKFAVIIGG